MIDCTGSCTSHLWDDMHAQGVYRAMNSNNLLKFDGWMESKSAFPTNSDHNTISPSLNACNMDGLN